jgi:Tol biopolymer transport system component
MGVPRRVCVLGLLISLGSVLPVLAQNTTTKVSVASGGAQGTELSDSPSISADGRYVAFSSFAPNLVPNDTNNTRDIFVHDRDTGVTERVSLGLGSGQANGGPSRNPAISGDGRFVAFVSEATNLVPADTNAAPDVFLRDRVAATTIRVSVASSGAEGVGDSTRAMISANGRYVAFDSTAANLVSGDTNGREDVFVRDVEARTTVRVSVATGGAQANGNSTTKSISGNGRIVAFTSGASNLVPNDTIGTDVFVRDLDQGITSRVSVGTGGVQGNDQSADASMSGDGRFIAFASRATNFDPLGGIGLFLHDRQTGQTTPLILVPASTTSNLSPTDGRISGNGRYVCFSLFTGTVEELFLFDRQTQARTRLTGAANGDPPDSNSSSCGLNGDATAIAFSSSARNLVVGDTNGRNDVFVRGLRPTSALDKSALTFAALTGGGTFVSQTSAQTVRLTQVGHVAVAWTATSDQPWLQVTAAGGIGSAELSISVAPVAGLPASGTLTGTITVSVPTAVNTLPPIVVTLTLLPNGTSIGPFGFVDTPTENRVGVTGAVPFTGWALDDVEVARVSICRAAFGTEVAPIDPNCGSAAEIFVGFAVFIDGARPDVAGAFPTHPRSTRAGWGFMVLTNMLPNQGNGQYRFTLRAQDREGTWAVLGTRTMTCANASATLPFGTIDTPLQGGVAFGSDYVNFGWALTPQPKTIPIDGSTIHVFIDGQDVGTASYNHLRPDIQASFPGFNNTDGAIGFFIFDSTLLTNGLHTISWSVTDNQGAVEGLGSRFFTVSNGTSALMAAASSARGHMEVDALPLDPSSIEARRGWDREAPHESFAAGATGVVTIRSEEVNRIELQLGSGDHTGYLRTPAGLAPLPIGSRLDAATNTFTWAPGVGFVGRYDFVFVRSASGHAISRREVRIILHPKGRGGVGPQVVIDVPRANATVRSPFMIGGWALDLDAPQGTGVTTLHAWAYPASGGTPIFLGATAYGGARPDVAAVHGDRFKESGFGLIAQGLPAGDYDLALFAWSTEQQGFLAPKMVRITVAP